MCVSKFLANCSFFQLFFGDCAVSVVQILWFVVRPAERHPYGLDERFVKDAPGPCSSAESVQSNQLAGFEPLGLCMQFCSGC